MADSISCTEQEEIFWCMLLRQLRLMVVVDSSSQRDTFVDNAPHCARMGNHLTAIHAEGILHILHH